MKLIAYSKQTTSHINISATKEPASTTSVMHLLTELEFHNKSTQLLYQIIRNSFLSSKSNVVSLPVAVDIYKKIERNIDVDSTERLELINPSDQRYSPIIKDFADAHGINTNIKIKQYRKQTVLSSLPSFAMGIGAQLYWVIHNQLRDQPVDVDTLFFYGPGRFSNKSPILEAAQKSEEIDPQFISKGIKPTKFLPDNVQEQDPVSLGRYTRLKDVKSSVDLFFSSIIPEIIFENNIEQLITEEINDQLGVCLLTTIKSHCSYAYKNLNFQVFPKYTSARAAIERTEPKNVIVGSLSSLNESILFAAQENQASAYHTPNGVINENIWDPNYTHFVSGQSAQRYIEDQTGIEDASMYLPTGRPNLSNLYCKYENKNYQNEFPGENNSFNLLVATQPQLDDYRQKFVEGILEAAEGLSIPVNITIKIHPLENAEFYEQFESHGVSISDGDLFEHLERSHMVVVPNSNVAFEGIIIGTPAIAFQPYPSILKPDIVESPIPICTNNDEISEWFAQLTSSEYNMLLNEQIEYITSHHQLEPNAEERIIKEIIEDT